jgi:hypothetical protein
MSGLEPMAIGKAALGAAAKAKLGDPKEREVLRELAKESGALDPAARAYAKRLAVKEQIRLKILQPLGMLVGISRDYFENDFADDLADRVAQIPDEELITPRFSVAGPTVQGIAFTVDEPELRSMYLNLLAAASDARVASTAHPSFAEIIRQLSSEEAVLLGPVLQRLELPIIEIRSKVATADERSTIGWKVESRHVMDWRDQGVQVFVPERSLQVVNWQRLGLVHVEYGTWLVPDGAYDAYDWAESNPRMIELRAALDTEDFQRITVERGVLTVTDFGKAFWRVVIAPRNETAPAELRGDSPA